MLVSAKHILVTHIPAVYGQSMNKNDNWPYAVVIYLDIHLYDPIFTYRKDGAWLSILACAKPKNYDLFLSVNVLMCAVVMVFWMCSLSVSASVYRVWSYSVTDISIHCYLFGSMFTILTHDCCTMWVNLKAM